MNIKNIIFFAIIVMGVEVPPFENYESIIAVTVIEYYGDKVIGLFCWINDT